MNSFAGETPLCASTHSQVLLKLLCASYCVAPPLPVPMDTWPLRTNTQAPESVWAGPFGVQDAEPGKTCTSPLSSDQVMTWSIRTPPGSVEGTNSLMIRPGWLVKSVQLAEAELPAVPPTTVVTSVYVP